MAAPFDSPLRLRICLTFLAVMAITIAVLLMVDLESQRMTEFRMKKREAETMLLYHLGKEPLRASIAPEDSRIMLISHCHLANDQLISERAMVDYSMRIAFLDDQGKAVFEKILTHTSRRSLVYDEKSKLSYENAFLAEGEGRLTDSRMSLISIKGRFPRGGTMLLTSESEVCDILVRMYRAAERDEIGRRKLIEQMKSDSQKDIAPSLGLRSIAELSEFEEKRILHTRWDRIEAVLSGGLSAPTHRIYYTGLRDTWDQPDNQDIQLQPGEATAVNLIGPGLLKVRLIAPLAQAKLMVEIRNIAIGSGLDKPGQTYEISPQMPLELAIPEAANSILVRSMAQETVTLRFLAPRNTLKALGYGRSILDENDQDVLLFLPELSRLSVAMTSMNEDGYLSYSTLGAGQVSPYKLEMRGVMPHEESCDLSVKIEYLDERGHLKGEAAIKTSIARSPFEYLSSGLSSLDEARISHPAEFHLIPPVGTRRFLVTTTPAAAIRVFVPVDLSVDETDDRDIYPEEIPGRIWQYARRNARAWAPLSPEDWINLTGLGRMAAVEAVVRLEDDPMAAWRRDQKQVKWVGAAVLGSQTDELLLLPSQQADLIKADSGWCRLRSGEKLPVILPENGLSGLLRGFLMTPPPTPLGSTSILRLANRTIHQVKNITRYEPIGLSKLRERDAALELEMTPQGEQWLYFAVDPQLPQACPLKRRFKGFSVQRLSPGQAAHFTLPYRGQPDFGANIVAYAAQPGKLQISLDGGIPRRVPAQTYERFTKNLRKEALPFDLMRSEPALLPLSSSQVRPLRSIFYPLETDLMPVNHRLSVLNTGRSTVYLRVFHRVDHAAQPYEVKVRTVK